MRYNNIDINKYRRNLYLLNELMRKYGICEILEYDEKESKDYSDNACVVVARCSRGDSPQGYPFQQFSTFIVFQHLHFLIVSEGRSFDI